MPYLVVKATTNKTKGEHTINFWKIFLVGFHVESLVCVGLTFVVKTKTFLIILLWVVHQ